MQINQSMRAYIIDYFKAYCRNVSLPQTCAEQFAKETLSSRRASEAIIILKRSIGAIKDKKILEIGSGFGAFVLCSHWQGAETFGLEPPDSESKVVVVSRLLLDLNGLDGEKYIKTGYGEAIPFADHFFDIVYSNQVLEHVSSPQKVLAESLRVLKKGGYIHFVFPNYGSFFEGHYGVFWPTYLPKVLVSPYLRLLGKNPKYAKTLQTGLNYFSVKAMLKPFARQIEVLGWGEDVFQRRMRTLQFSEWACLGVVKNWVRLLHKLRIIRLVTWLFIKTKSFTPIILTIRKK